MTLIAYLAALIIAVSALGYVLNVLWIAGWTVLGILAVAGAVAWVGRAR